MLPRKWKPVVPCFERVAWPVLAEICAGDNQIHEPTRPRGKAAPGNPSSYCN